MIRCDNVSCSAKKDHLADDLSDHIPDLHET